MYADPAHIRNHRLNLSLNEVEQRLIEAAAEFNQQQPSVFIRQLVLDALIRHEANFQAEDGELRHARP